ncbi:MAG: hypothetical protein ABIV50_13040 [Opitutus sp.]
MKAYVVITGIVFLLIVMAHGARLISEGFLLIKEPAFLLTSILSIVLSVWAGSVYRKIPSRNEQ